jgi:hypothetical protein
VPATVTPPLALTTETEQVREWPTRGAVAFEAMSTVLSCRVGAGEIAESALASDGRSTAGGGTASTATMRDTKIGEEVPEKETPLTHVHVTWSWNEVPIGA